MRNNNPPYNDKVLKIFTSIRCLNRDQLPRYLEGRLTEVEKHLVEQHLTDCDLCFEALQALEKEPNMDRYNGFTSSIQQFIHQSVRPVSHVQRVAQYARKEQKKESMLAYFWLLAFLLLGVGSIFVLKGHLRNQSVIASNKAVMVPDTTQEIAPAPLAENKHQEITTHPSSAAIVSTTSAAVTPTPVVHHPPVTKPAKDSVTTKKPAAPAKPAVPAPQKTKDSVVKKAPAPAPKAPDTLKKEEDKPVQVVKATPTAPLEDATTKDQDADKQDKTEKKPTPSVAAPPPSNNDEYLYKAAMVYQQQGDLGEAINRYKRLADISTGRYAELSRYQLAICYRSKGQAGKARRMFREVVRMNGSMKDAAQKALDSM